MKPLYFPPPSRHIEYQGLIWLTLAVCNFYLPMLQSPLQLQWLRKCFKMMSEEGGNEMLWSEADVA
jgi:hypothetical protein